MSDDNIFIRRPKPGDSEEDILALQSQWQQFKTREETVKIQRVTRKAAEASTSSGTDSPQTEVARKPLDANRKYKEAAKFTIDLDQIAEEYTNPVLFGVTEKNVECLQEDRSDEIAKQSIDRQTYSKDEGFPDILDLSAYYSSKVDKHRAASEGKSFFAAEFDRLHGRIEEAFVEGPEPSEELESDFYKENESYISSLSSEKIKEFREEIEERLDPKMLEFLAKRYKKKKEEPVTDKPIVSRFKKQKLAEAEASTANEPRPSTSKADQNIERLPPKLYEPETAAPPNPTIDDIVKQLEVLDEFADRSETENYSRLATDAVQMDFAAKAMKSMFPRQQQNALRLFEVLKFPIDGNSDELCNLARSKIDEIKLLYLEEVESDGRRYTQFASGLNPLIDGGWTLRPVRTVLDAIQKREDDGEMTSDDVDFVRLSLLWTMLLQAERPSVFFAFAEPNEIYVRISEVFLLGSQIMADDTIMACVARLMDRYVLKAAIDGRLSLRMTSKVADLDAFMPFYEDLLRHYESYSLGDVQFARSILIGAYLNSALTDSLECRFGIWSPKQHTARQMTLRVEDVTDILAQIRILSAEQAKATEEQYYTQYISLLGAYAASIRDEKVTRDRNPAMFTIAAEELGRFVERHKNDCSSSNSGEFASLIEIVRSSVAGKLNL